MRALRKLTKLSGRRRNLNTLFGSSRYFVNSHAALALGNQAQRLFCPKVENPSRRTPALRYSCDQRSTLVWPTNPALWTFVVVVVGGSRSTVFSSLNGFGAIRLLPTMYSWRLLRTLMLFPTTISPEKSGFTWYDAVAVTL